MACSQPKPVLLMQDINTIFGGMSVEKAAFQQHLHMLKVHVSMQDFRTCVGLIFWLNMGQTCISKLLVVGTECL